MKNNFIKREQFSDSKRKDIVTKLTLVYGLRCWYCGYRFNKGETVFLDHIHPFSQGGKDDLDNLALSCRFCNSHKFYYPVETFLKYLAYIRTGRFSCPILEKYKEKIDNVEYDILNKNFY